MRRVDFRQWLNWFVERLFEEIRLSEVIYSFRYHSEDYHSDHLEEFVMHNHGRIF